MLESLFNKIEELKACNFITKETPTQVYSCEYFKICKKTFFYRTHPVAASESSILNLCFDRALAMLLEMQPLKISAFFVSIRV